MKLTIRQLRHIIREAISVTTTLEDPTQEGGGFYDYDTERGEEMYSDWYRLPGKAEGTEGDPGRPEDAQAYLGMKQLVPSDDGSEGTSQNDSDVTFDDDETNGPNDAG